MKKNNPQFSKVTTKEALDYHKKNGVFGKVSMAPTKPLMTQRDLSLAYSPGVAAPCLEIQKDASKVYDYTAKGNYVAVITNGTAVLGLGNLGPLAAKPVMEGKSVLFKRFADIDSVDIEVDTQNVEEFIDSVKHLGPSWGGINLEDIKGPDCFIIEQQLIEKMNIPVFHDDQHGTAIICAAGLINAVDITNRKMSELKVVVSGAGAAGISCVELIKAIGVPNENVILCDRSGVIYKGREENINQWKSAHATDTPHRTLSDAICGADLFLGLSAKGEVTKDMVASMAKNPIIFAMANPDPEITPEDVAAVRDDAIIATGRSDYPNQVNNVMGFPYIFRGALDVRASKINEEMKLAAAYALANLARKPVSSEVSAAYSGREMVYGPQYIIPVPFDPRLISTIPLAVAKAAMETGVAGKPIEDLEKYKRELTNRLNPTANIMGLIFDKIKANPQNIIFAEGEEERVIRAAAHWRDNKYGIPKLVGRTDSILKTMKHLDIEPEGIEIHNAAITQDNDKYIDFLYGKLQRKGYIKRDCVRLCKTDRNFFSLAMLGCGGGDAMITGITKNYYTSLNQITSAVEPNDGEIIFGLSILTAKGKTVFIADTTVNELPTPEDLAKITIQSAALARNMGVKPRVALLSFSSFGNLPLNRSCDIQKVVEILDNTSGIDFEYDGEMAADVALNEDLMKMYPFCRLSAPANVLIMPALHSANIASKLLEQLGGGANIGPMLIGTEKPVQIVQMNSSVTEILNIAALATIQAISRKQSK